MACATQDAIAIEVKVEDSDNRRRCQNKSRDIKDGLTAQQKDERQDNRDRRPLVRQHPSDLLGSLTCGRDRQRTARRLDCALSFNVSNFTVSNFPRARCEAHDAHAYTQFLHIHM